MWCRFFLTVALGLSAAGTARGGDYPILAAGLRDVKVTRGFWFDRLETNRLVTLKTDFAKCNETPRIANITNAVNRAWGTFGGIFYDDSDVFKVMEGAAYVLAAHPDAELEKYMTWLIGRLAKAQEPDGYLYTARTLGAERVRRQARWEALSWSHELYNQGHMIEAAVAWHEATGRRDFLDIAVKSADLMCRTFGPGPTQLKLTSGHQEIELALCKLFRATHERKYLDLAKFFLDVRGNAAAGGPVWGVSVQAHAPVLRQDEAYGHAVRAAYMFSGMTDVGFLANDRTFRDAADRLWENVVGRKLHLNGGIGAHRHYVHPTLGAAGECFGADYDLPNEKAYLETCAAIGNVLWNERLFRAHGETKYVDVMERTLYNGFTSGISLSGDRFFYENPQASTGAYRRVAWFSTSCCPVNDVRFLPQVPTFAFETDATNVYWNLFMEGKTTIAGATFAVKTDYPWNGKITLTLLNLATSQPSQPLHFSTLKIRIPGWAVGRPVPSDLYVQTSPSSFMDVLVSVNGQALNGCPGADGYVAVSRDWKAGDVVTLDLPMPVKRIRAHEKVAADRGRLAVERGPVVYCAEGCDNGGKAFGATLPEVVTFAEEAVEIGGKRYPALRASNGLRLIPYCLWGNRQPGNDMDMWFKGDR